MPSVGLRAIRSLLLLFVVLGAVLVGVGAASGRAASSGGAQQTPTTQPSTTTTAPPVTEMPVSVAPAPSAQPSAGKALPVTGTDVTALFIVGTASISGGLLVMAARRRTPQEP